MSSILTLDELASLPKPDIAPDPVHRMIYFLKAIEAFMQGELCADSAEKHEHLCNFWGDYWQSFWKTYVAFDDAIAYLRGDAAILVKQHGLNAQEHIQQLDFIAKGIVQGTRRFLLRAQDVDIELHRQCHQFIRQSIADLRVLLELMGIPFSPWEINRIVRKGNLTDTKEAPVQQKRVLVDNEDEKPCWDTSLRELKFRGKVIKQWNRPAQNQTAIIEEFQKQGWPPVIAAPLKLSGKALGDAIDDLRKQVNGRGITFGRNGTGTGIAWKICEPPDKVKPTAKKLKRRKSQ